MVDPIKTNPIQDAGFILEAIAQAQKSNALLTVAANGNVKVASKFQQFVVAIKSAVTGTDYRARSHEAAITAFISRLQEQVIGPGTGDQRQGRFEWDNLKDRVRALEWIPGLNIEFDANKVRDELQTHISASNFERTRYAGEVLKDSFVGGVKSPILHVPGSHFKTEDAAELFDSFSASRPDSAFRKILAENNIAADSKKGLLACYVHDHLLEQEVKYSELIAAEDDENIALITRNYEIDVQAIEAALKEDGTQALEDLLDIDGDDLELEDIDVAQAKRRAPALEQQAIQWEVRALGETVEPPAFATDANTKTVAGFEGASTSTFGHRAVIDERTQTLKEPKLDRPKPLFDGKPSEPYRFEQKWAVELDAEAPLPDWATPSALESAVARSETKIYDEIPADLGNIHERIYDDIPDPTIKAPAAKSTNPPAESVTAATPQPASEPEEIIYATVNKTAARKSQTDADDEAPEIPERTPGYEQTIGANASVKKEGETDEEFNARRDAEEAIAEKYLKPKPRTVAASTRSQEAQPLAEVTAFAKRMAETVKDLITARFKNKQGKEAESLSKTTWYAESDAQATAQQPPAETASTPVRSSTEQAAWEYRQNNPLHKLEENTFANKRIHNAYISNCSRATGNTQIIPLLIANYVNPTDPLGKVLLERYDASLKLHLLDLEQQAKEKGVDLSDPQAAGTSELIASFNAELAAMYAFYSAEIPRLERQRLEDAENDTTTTKL